ncbi:cytochrome c [Sulfurimonas sp. NW7]|uniref:c-type cytochrome n=1 Tax=Sulfurimonas sp. NW7 TaxID=2922727 RepID=UPI003DA7C27E
MKRLLIPTLFLTGSLFAQSAQEIIQNNGCLSCHAVASKKAAPAFAGIGMRNKRFEGENAKEVIMASIKNGSQGKYPRFSDTAMPSFANLTQEQLSTVADYILAQSSQAKGMMGKGGGMGRGQGMGMGGGM